MSGWRCNGRKPNLDALKLTFVEGWLGSGQ
jgi:hypothetical protein